MTANRWRACVVVSLWLLTLAPVPGAGANQPIDWQRAQELRRREQQGQTLTDEERAYLQRAKQEYAKQNQPAQAQPCWCQGHYRIHTPESGCS